MFSTKLIYAVAAVFAISTATMAQADDWEPSNKPRQSDGKKDWSKKRPRYDRQQDDSKQDGRQDPKQDDRPHKKPSHRPDHQDQDQQHGDYKHPKSKKDGYPNKHYDPNTARFNVVCFYKNKHNPEGFRACKASAVFDKTVTTDGGEVADLSPEPETPLSSEIPEFKVECEGESRWNDHSRRFTDLLSTRIQGLTGPHPAISLPRGALHTGFHVSDSYLEIETDEQTQLRTAGKCYVWTGRP